MVLAGGIAEPYHTDMRATKSFDATDTYLELIRRFPLRRLKSAQQHEEAVKVLSQVSLRHQGTRDSGMLDYIDILADLIDQYERTAQLKIDASQTSPRSIARHLMDSNHLTVSGLAREIGISQSNLSEMLSGRREFSKRVIAGIRSSGSREHTPQASLSAAAAPPRGASGRPTTGRARCIR